MIERPQRRERPNWPRLMGEEDAAAYLSIGATMLNEKGPAPKRSRDMIGNRKLWDIRDLDRWADALDGQPLTAPEAEAESRDTERRFLEKRQGKG